MPVNWKDPDAFTRLLAAMVAAQDMKLDYRRIASMYGNGATYDTIEGRFRIIRKEAAKLKEEVDSGVRPEAPARGTPKKEKTLGGRVAKSVNATPTKKRGNATKGVKQEPSCNGESFASGGGDGGEADGGIMDAEGLDEFLNMGQEGY